MSNWYVVQPEATVNLITNPSFERATTGWTAGAGTLERSTTYQRRGLYSGRYTPSSGTTDGLYFALTLADETTYTFSVDVWGAAGVSYQIYAYDTTATAVLGSAVAWTGRGTWSRQVVTFTTGANTGVRLYIAKNSSASVAAFYVDGAQCEAKAYATTYADGDRDGCLWAAGAHTSTSSRLAQYYGGGRVVDLEALGANGGLRIQEAQGIGMPPIRQVSNASAVGDGSIFQRALAEARSLTLVGTFVGSSRKNLVQRRRLLVDAFKLDRLTSQQPVQLRYAGYDVPLAIDLFYDAGLEFNQAPGNWERVALRFVAHDPYWFEVVGTGGVDSADNGSSADIEAAGNTAAALTVQTEVGTVNYLAQRNTETGWGDVGGGLNGSVSAVALGPDGSIYVCGDFTTAGGVTVNRIARWDGAAWSDLDGGMDNDVYCLAFGPDGYLYAGGAFTIAGGTGANQVARWDGSAWAAVGTGLNGAAYAITVGPDGSLYIGGDFTTAGGTGANRVARWNGTAWSALGTGLNDRCVTLLAATDGYLYAGGSFTTAGGGAATYIARWSGSAWSAVGAGTNGAVRGMAFGPDGYLYICGSFTTAGGISANRMARWNGATWVGLGDGLDDVAYCMAIDAAGVVYVGGAFTTAGGLTLPDGLAKWTGAGWFGLDIDLPDNSAVLGIVVAGDGTLTIGFNETGTAIATGVTAVTNNGSASSYGRFTLTGPGRIYQIVNLTTGEAIYFDLVLLNGETIVLDLRPAKKSLVSSFRGNIVNSILSGSDVGTWRLAPGVNQISVFAADEAATTLVEWSARHWSLDGGAR